MPVPAPSDFFKVKRSFAEIKQEIFGRFFDSWCQNLVHASGVPLLFIDLSAGADTEATSPVDNYSTIYKSIIRRRQLNEAIQTFYFSKHKATLEQLPIELEALPIFQELVHPPVALTGVAQKAQLSELLATEGKALVFADPFESSYAQQLILQAVSTSRPDLFMQLSPGNITKAITGSKASQPLTALLGERLSTINAYFRKEKDKVKRQRFVLDQFISLLHEKGYVTLLFRANMPDTEEPEHYLLFASENSLAYRTFKEIVLPYSCFQEDGVPMFSANSFLHPQFTLFQQAPEYTIANLTEQIVKQAGVYKYKSIEKIYVLDSNGTNYSKENYLAAVEQLRNAGKVELLNASTMQPIRRAAFSSVVRFR
ncbi:MAG TPA: hypothetical protein VIG72_10500 [Pontibacter sp.]